QRCVLLTLTNNHIVLIGFKHVGKTCIGQKLAKFLNRNFLDLDKELEKAYTKTTLQTFTCRQIMSLHGEPYFRILEAQTLEKIIQSTSCVLSLGGGTSLKSANQKIIKKHLVLHINAPRASVFKRLRREGYPAFFNPHEDPYAL